MKPHVKKIYVKLRQLGVEDYLASSAFADFLMDEDLDDYFEVLRKVVIAEASIVIMHTAYRGYDSDAFKRLLDDFKEPAALSKFVHHFAQALLLWNRKAHGPTLDFQELNNLLKTIDPTVPLVRTPKLSASEIKEMLIKAVERYEVTDEVNYKVCRDTLLHGASDVPDIIKNCQTLSDAQIVVVGVAKTWAERKAFVVGALGPFITRLEEQERGVVSRTPTTNSYTGKPRIFIGSTVEKLEIARAVQLELDHEFTVTLWSQNFFEAGNLTWEDLVLKATTKNFECAVFVFGDEDTTTSRGSTQQSPRDNVLLEFGLFTGALGRDRVWILVDRNQVPKIATDLNGINRLDYEGRRPDKNWQAAVGPACSMIRKRICAQS